MTKPEDICARPDCGSGRDARIHTAYEECLEESKGMGCALTNPPHHVFVEPMTREQAEARIAELRAMFPPLTPPDALSLVGVAGTPVVVSVDKGLNGPLPYITIHMGEQEWTGYRERFPQLASLDVAKTRQLRDWLTEALKVTEQA